MKNLLQTTNNISLPTKDSAKRILLGQLGSNGDCLHATTLARQIKSDYPNCHLTWAISSLCRSMIENNPYVDEIWEITAGNWNEIAAAWYWFEQEAENCLKEGKFDAIFLTQVSPNNYQNYDSTTRVSLYRGYPKPITVPIQNILRLRDYEVENVRIFAEKHNLSKYSQVILFEYTSNSSQSFVTPDYALSVAQSIVSLVPNCSIILSSHRQINTTDERIIDGSILTLRENAELTKYCTLVIGCSSGVTQTALSDWAKPLPMIQLLLGSTSVYASIAHDLEYWGIPSDQVLEMTDTSSQQLINCVYTTFTKGFPEARNQFNQQIPLDFNFYLTLTHIALVQKEKHLEAMRSLLYVVERYGWHKQIKHFVETELMPKVKLKIQQNKSKERNKYIESTQEFSLPEIAALPNNEQGLFWSVMIPTYNKFNHLEQTLKTVLDQAPSHEEMQIEVVNDHPDIELQDRMEVLVNKIGKNRVKFYRHNQTDIGQTAIFNLCLERAKGNWVHILHDDDYVLPGFYEKLHRGIKNNPDIGAAFCRHYLVNENSENLSISFLERETAGILTNYIEKVALASSIEAVSVVAKRSVFEKLGGYCPQALSAADWEMWKRVACYYDIWYEPLPLACRRIDKDTWTSRLIKTGGNILSARKAIEITHSYLPPKYKNLTGIALENFAISGIILADKSFDNQDYDAAVKLLIESLKCSDSNNVIDFCLRILRKHEQTDLIGELLTIESEYKNDTQFQNLVNKLRNTYQITASIFPKIIIDGVFFQLYKTGIARVWKSLLEEWASTEFAAHILFLDRANTAPKINGIRYRTISPYNYNDTESDRQMLQQICDEEGAELFISTYYTTPVHTPSVFMAYDMIPEVLGGKLNQPMWREKHNAIKHASTFLSISENTAKDLSEFFPDISLESITVAHCGVDPLFCPASENEINAFKYKYGINKPYFLLGGLGGYKNEILFLQAFAQLSNKHSFDIVATGAGSQLSPEWRQYTAGCTFHGLQLSDAELRLAYAGAVALVYPSQYEGFGMPVAEAMACGCPVITTPNASLPEVGGDAVIYVKDNDIEGMANALCDVQKPSLRRSLISAGLAQAQKFSWSKMADIISNVLINQTLESLPFNLREINLIMFPDWTQSEYDIYMQLGEVIKTLATDANADKTTLLIYVSNTDPETADLILSSIAMNLMIEDEIDITERMQISLIEKLSEKQWQKLLPYLQKRILLEVENQEVINKFQAEKLPIFEL